MGYYDDNASVLSGRTAHSVRSKKPKVLIKRRSRSRERHHGSSSKDKERERDRDRHHRHRREKSRSRSDSRSHSRSRSRDRAPSLQDTAASIVGGVFGLGGGGGGHGSGSDRGPRHARSFGSLFGFGDHSRSSYIGGRSSYYKRSSRAGLVERTVKKIKKLFADLMRYARTHPAKVVALVLVPLVTGGALTALLARVGLRLPPSVERLVAIASRVASGDSSGLVTEAVRMVRGGGGGGGGGRAGRVVTRGSRAGAGDYAFQHREVRRTFRPDEYGSGWTEGIKAVTKTLF